MSNPFLTQVDTFSMTKGLGEAFQQGQKNAEWLKAARQSREMNQQEFDWKKEDRTANQHEDAQFDINAPLANIQRPQTLAGGLAASMGGQQGGGNTVPVGDKSRIAYDFFVKQGLSPVAAAAKTGSFMAESNLNTAARNRGDGRDGSDSIGIAQWNGPRAQGLRTFAAQNGLDPNDYNTQLRYAWHELNGPEAATLEKLRTAQNVQEAAAAAVGYERPAGWSAANPTGAYNFSGRLANAQNVLNQFGPRAEIAETPEQARVLEMAQMQRQDAQRAAQGQAPQFADIYGGNPAPQQMAQAPAQPQQQAGYDQRADMPSPNAQEAAFYAPGGQQPPQTLAGGLMPAAVQSVPVQPQQIAQQAPPQQPAPQQPASAPQQPGLSNNAQYWARAIGNSKLSPEKRELAKMMFARETSGGSLELLKDSKGRPIGMYDKNAGRVLNKDEAAARGIQAMQGLEEDKTNEIKNYEYSQKNPEFTPWNQSMKKAGAQNISVGKDESKRDEKIGEASGGDIGGYITGIRPAYQKMQALDQMDQALSSGGDNMTLGGPLAKTFLAGKQLFSSLTGGSVEGLPETEVAQKVGFGLATAAVKAISARPTQMEFAKALENNPGILLSKQGNAAMISIMKQQAQAEIDLGKLARKKENWDDWDDKVESYYRQNPIQSPFFKGQAFGAGDVAILQQSKGNTVEWARTGGSAGQQQPQQPPPVRVTTPQEAARLPSGTPILLPDGTIGRVP